ncbi:hypothetical protein ACLOJK_030512 [Asimina triloba]
MALAPSPAFSLLSYNPRAPTKLFSSTSAAAARVSLCYLPLFLTPPANALNFRRSSATQEIVAVEEEKPPEAEIQDENIRKLFIFNLPWTFSAPEIRTLFSECGTVEDVEVVFSSSLLLYWIIKKKDGRHKGYVFVTMSTGDEAGAAIEKFDSFELDGRVIRVEYAKSMKRPSTLNPASSNVGETLHKIFVSNLAWKARSNDLRELFAAFNPVSARVVFDSPSGGSAGYGFVSFSTKEDAEAAISVLEGQEFMGRPLRVKFSQENVDGSGNNPNDEDSSEEQFEQS